MYALDRIIDIIKIIHGTSLESRNTSNQAAASLGVEDLEIFALELEMKYLSEERALNEEEKSLIQVCIHLYNLYQNESISDELRGGILHNLKKACFRLSKIHEKNSGRIMENGSTEDKVWILFDGLKTPYYTVKESERTLYRIDDKVIGDEDPFFDAIRKLYGGRGIRGYRDAHPEYFINVQNSWIRQASRRYRKYEYVPFSVKKVVGIILTLVMAILLWDGLKVYPVPIIILWAFGCWLGMTGILCIGCTHRFNVDIKILEARIRIGLALGIQKKGQVFWDYNGMQSPSSDIQSYFFDYGYNIDPDADSSARESLYNESGYKTEMAAADIRKNPVCKTKQGRAYDTNRINKKILVSCVVLTILINLMNIFIISSSTASLFNTLIAAAILELPIVLLLVGLFRPGEYFPSIIILFGTAGPAFILIFISIVIIDQIFLLVFGFSLMNADSNTLIGSVATIILSLLYFSSWNFLISISTEWIKEKKQ